MKKYSIILILLLVLGGCKAQPIGDSCFKMVKSIRGGYQSAMCTNEKSWAYDFYCKDRNTSVTITNVLDYLTGMNSNPFTRQAGYAIFTETKDYIIWETVISEIPGQTASGNLPPLKSSVSKVVTDPVERAKYLALLPKN